MTSIEARTSVRSLTLIGTMEKKHHTCSSCAQHRDATPLARSNQRHLQVPQQAFFFFLSLWTYLWLAETSQQPISQTSWLKVAPHCNHCTQQPAPPAGAATSLVFTRNMMRLLRAATNVTSRVSCHN